MLNASTESCEAKPPSTLRPTLPGRSWPSANTITLRSTSVMSARTSRRARNFSIGSAILSQNAEALARNDGGRRALRDGLRVVRPC